MIDDDYTVWIEDDVGFVYPVEEIETKPHEKTIVLKAKRRK